MMRVLFMKSFSVKLCNSSRAFSRFTNTNKKIFTNCEHNHCQYRRFHASKKENNAYINYMIAGGISFGLIYSGIYILNRPLVNETNIQPEQTDVHNLSKAVAIDRDISSETAENKIENSIEETDIPNYSIENETSLLNLKDRIPSYAPYLIIGGGTAAMSAFKSIRSIDPQAKILIVTEETYKPYMRPPLSKDMWFTTDENLVANLKFKQWNGDERSIFYMDDEFYTIPFNLNEQIDGGVAVLSGQHVTKIDVKSKKVTLASDWEISFDKCLIATGGCPKNLECFEKPEMGDKITLFRNIKDFQKLQKIAKEGKTIAIIGGGFLGSELSVALSNFTKKYGGNVIQIFPESGNLGKILPSYLSKWVTEKVRDEGVTVITNSSIREAAVDDEKLMLTLAKSQTGAKWIIADHAVVAIGIKPNSDISSELEVDPNNGGYLVNAELQARDSIWVAGDAACFYDVKLGRRRVEHHDHAVVTGRLAGENMTGAAKPYMHQSMFWSDLGSKIGFEAIGIIDSSLKTFGIFARTNEWEVRHNIAKENDEHMANSDNIVSKESKNKSSNVNNEYEKNDDDQYGKGVIFYLKNDRVVGILTWNLFNRMPIARKVLNEQYKIDDLEELGKLFKINYESSKDLNN